MDDPEIMPSSNKPGAPDKTWAQAYWRFLRSPHEHKVLKLMPLVLIGIIPLSIVDDFLLSFLGVADDIPTSLVAVIVIIYTWIRVREYR